MKVLLVHKFYFPFGGDSIYNIELEKLLNENGIETAVFSMSHERNISQKYKNFYPSKIDFNAVSIKNIIETLRRPIYSKEVDIKFNKFLDFFEPDIIHLQGIHSQISPIVAKIAYKRKMPVVWTLHDYKAICPSYTCLRNEEICELCFTDKFNVVKKRCMKNSYIASTLAYFESKKWNLDTLQEITNLFISPSQFLKGKMIEAGMSSDKIIVLNNFIHSSKIKQEPAEKEKYYCYVGRISKEKGVETLLKASEKLPGFKLKIIGTGDLLQELKEKYKLPHIEFLGFQNWETIERIVKSAYFTVIPSEWYENNPLSVIESLSLGTPVLGARIGGIPELIINLETGMLFESRSVADLSIKIDELFKSDSMTEMGNNCILYSQKNFSSEMHFDKLFKIYNHLINVSQKS